MLDTTILRQIEDIIGSNRKASVTNEELSLLEPEDVIKIRQQERTAWTSRDDLTSEQIDELREILSKVAQTGLQISAWIGEDHRLWRKLVNELRPI
jgi:hypothetical protein